MEPFSFFISPDSYLLQVEISSLCLSKQSDIAVFTFWGDEGLTTTFWEHLTLQGLFATPKLIILRNAQLIQSAPFKELSQSLRRVPSSVSIILCLEVAYERGKPRIPAHILKLPCFTYAQNNGLVKELPPLTQATLPKFIQAEALKKKIQISSQLISKLVQILPLDAATIASEIEKLSLTINDKGHVPDDAISIIETSGESSIFDLLRIIQSGNNTSEAWSMLRDEKGDSLIFSFLAIVTREARLFWQLLMGEPVAMPPYAIGQKKALAQSLGVRGVASLWKLALEADKSIKSGEKSPDQAFEILTAELFMLFRRQTAGRR